MSPAPAGSSPLRFASPGMMIMCLVMFFLPWVEIQCPMPKDMGKMDMSKPPSSADMVWTGLIKQSGFQAATGGYSFSDSTLESASRGEKKGGKSGEKDGPAAAPLLLLYLIAVIGGIAVGFAMPSTAPRKYALIGCAALALLSAGGQAAIGFPVSKEIKNDMGKMGGGMGGMDDFGPPGKSGKSGAKEDQFKTVLKFPFYLALLFAVGALVTAAIEPTGPSGKKARRPDDDEPEAEAVEEDDRPRRRRAEPDAGGGGTDKPKAGGADNPFANLE